MIANMGTFEMFTQPFFIVCCLIIHLFVQKINRFVKGHIRRPSKFTLCMIFFIKDILLKNYQRLESKEEGPISSIKKMCAVDSAKQ